MAAPKIATAEQRRARSVELAVAANLTGTAELKSERTGMRLYHVPSEDRTLLYPVAYDTLSDTTRCSCPAGSYGNPCKHAGVVFACEDQRAAALATPVGQSEAWRSWMNGLDY